MLYLAIVDKLNRAGFVVAPYNTPEEVPSVKSVSGPARHVGEADKRVRDSRGGSPCGENRCGIGECREGEGTRGAPQERAKLTRTIFFILRSEVSSIEKYESQAPGLGRVGRAGSGLGQRRTALVTGARDPASAALLGCWKILG